MTRPWSKLSLLLLLIGTIATAANTYNLSFSTSANRSSGAFLQSATLSGNRYLFTSLASDATNFSPTGISKVCFYLDTSPQGATSTLFSPTAVPVNTNVGGASGNLELGVKFSSTTAGQISAIRFHKSSGNTGTHIGSIWSASGTKLGSVTFVNETASGWQEQTLPTPIAIAANTTYVASYHLQVGNFSSDSQYFSGARSSPPLTTPAGAGVYTYGGTGGSVFPTSTYQNQNYWVDVKFQPPGTAPPVSCSSTSPYDYNESTPAPLVPGFVQFNTGPSTLQSSNTSVAVPFSAAQIAGDLNVVAIGWGDAHTISSVTDTRGNSYSIAATLATNGTINQVMYYAKNIAAGANTVTVTFNAATAYPDVRIAEYKGVNTSAPSDGSSSGTGTGAATTSNAVTTNAASEVLVSAGTSSSSFSSAGAGWNKRAINVFGNIFEDSVVNNTGSWTATATNGSGAWIMQLATFKAASGAGIAPWDTTKVPNGPHTITAVVTKTDSSTETDSATFTVNNAAANHSVDLAWVKGTPAPNPVTYTIGRHVGACSGGFSGSSIASGLGSPAYTDQTVTSGSTYCYAVLQIDTITGLRSPYSTAASAVIP